MTTSRVSTKECDLLEQDDPIRGQKYVCMSFVSPEDAIKNKEVYVFGKFVKNFSNDVGQLLDNLKLKFEGNNDVQSMVSLVRERHDYLWSEDALQSEYQHFKDTNSEKLESDFYEKNEFHTSIRGFKVRGVYESVKEAQQRAEHLKKKDPNFNIYIAEVGCWCPWSPNPTDIADQEYAETELNTLMKKYKENMQIRDQMYKERFEQLKASIEDEKKRITNDVETTSQVVEELEQADPWTNKTTASAPNVDA